MVPLHLLAAGETGCICDVSGESSLVVRLEEMGLREGVYVRMVQPGQPCIIAFDGHRLSFRGENDVTVLVTVQPPGSIPDKA